MTMYESDPNPSNPYDDPNHDQPRVQAKGVVSRSFWLSSRCWSPVLPWPSSACDPPMTMLRSRRVRELSCRTPRIRQRLRMR